MLYEGAQGWLLIMNDIYFSFISSIEKLLFVLVINNHTDTELQKH